MIKVVPYSQDALTQLFTEFCDSGEGRESGKLDNPMVREKHHIEYLDGYLRAIACKTILVEHPYIDRDYLEDFAAYHVRSFYPYRRQCARLHFFDVPLGEDDVELLIVSDPDAISVDALQSAYQGFAVIKPLPFTVVGRTCLRTYEDEGSDRRVYPVAYRECVDLFGIELSVMTLPFQEQDRDVAACASSALWSVFHATGKRFQHAIPSPVEITNIATKRSSYDERVLPNQNGLTSRQIADAIRSVELEPSTIGLGVKNDASRTQNSPANRAILLRLAASAYLRAGVPCILLSETHEQTQKGDRVHRGNHAMALSGYRMPSAPPVPYSEKQTLFDASRINRFYAHDDQVGPFARMFFEDGMTLKTAQVNKHKKRFRIFAEPTHLMVPLYHKIRIPFAQILKLAIQIDELIETFRSVGSWPVAFKDRLVWDIQLIRLDDYRKLLRASDLAPAVKREVLTMAMPRFVWRLHAADQVGAPLFDLLFDPTDLLQGRLFLGAVPFHQPSLDFVMFVFVGNGSALFRELPMEAMYSEFARRIGDKPPEPGGQFHQDQEPN